MCSDQIGSGFFHALHIEYFLILVLIFPLENIRDLSHMDGIGGGLFLCGVTAVKTLVHLLNRNDCNVIRQIMIQIGQDLSLRKMLLNMKICHLAFGMHARIRSPRTNNFHRMSCHLSQHCFYFSLNGQTGAVLPLPALVSCSVILDCDFIVVHTFYPCFTAI